MLSVGLLRVQVTDLEASRCYQLTASLYYELQDEFIIYKHVNSDDNSVADIYSCKEWWV